MTSELEVEAQPQADGCFPEPPVDDRTIRRGEGILDFLRRSTMDHAVELRRFTNANLRLLPADVSGQLCRALHGDSTRPSVFELVLARTLQDIGARELSYETTAQSGRRPDLRATFDDGPLVVDATVPEFDAEIARDQESFRPLIEIIEDLAPEGWSFFVEELPRIGPNDSQREFKRTLSAEFAKFSGLPKLEPSASPLSRQGPTLCADHPQGGIRLRLGGRSASGRAFAGGPVSSAWGDTDRRVEKALRRKRAQLRGGDAPALVAIAGGMGESLEDFDIALFGRTWEKQDQRGRVLQTGFNPSGIWGRLQGGESVIAGVLAYCHWQWTHSDDPVLYVNPRFGGSLPQAFSVLHRREFRNGAIASTAARSSGLFSRLREAAGLAP